MCSLQQRQKRGSGNPRRLVDVPPCTTTSQTTQATAAQYEIGRERSMNGDVASYRGLKSMLRGS
jgi:hypothetical protein